MSIPDLLKDCTLFMELYDREIEKLVKHCKVTTYERGELILQAGHSGRVVFVILYGSVQIPKKDAAGSVERYHVLRKGDVLGEAALLEDRVFTSDVIAKTTSSLLSLPYEDIFRHFKSEPRVFAIMMLNLSRMLARRLRER